MHMGIREGQLLAMVVLPTLMVKYKVDQSAVTRASTSIRNSKTSLSGIKERLANYSPESVWNGDEFDLI